MKNLLIAFGLFTLAIPKLGAQNQDSQLANHLFYGNSGHDMRLMGFLAGGWAVGVGQAKDWLYLITPQGHLADSLDPQLLAHSRGFGRFVGRLQPISPHQMLVMCAMANVLIEQRSGKFQVLGSWQALRQDDGRLAMDGTFRLGNWLVGYEREKIQSKSNYPKKDHQNFPQFWVRQLTTPPRTFGPPVTINPPLPAQTDDLYYDWKDPMRVQLLLQIHAQAVSVFQGKFYLNVTRANRCYIYDTLTHKVSYLAYPPVSRGQSHFCYFDADNGQMYVVKKNQPKNTWCTAMRLPTAS
jgi:hypothetical protein